MDSIVVLPLEIVEKIFSYLQLRELIACSEVCVSWHHLANRVSLWRPFMRSFENCWLNSPEMQNYNAITTNFVGSPCGLNMIMTSSTLSPNNLCKNLIRQHNILKFNWSKGICEVHSLKKQSLTFSTLTVEYPFKTPQDCLYYPIMGTRLNGEEGFYLIRMDAKPKIVCRLIECLNRNSYVEVVCVMRDYVVWVIDSKVQCLSLQCDLKNPKVKTLGMLDKSEYTFLTMDFNHIIAWSHKWLYVWCKETLELKLDKTSPSEKTISNVCLDNGLLIVSFFQFLERVSSIEVSSIRNNSMLRHEFVADGRVIDVKCSENFMVVHYQHNQNHRFEIRDKNTTKIKFSRSFPITGETEIFEIFNNNSAFIYKCRYSKLFKCDLHSGVVCQPEAYWYHLNRKQFLFDNILVGRTIFGSVEVWDWVKNIRLHHFMTGYSDEIQSFENHVSEARLIRCSGDVFKVFGFG